MNGESEDLYGTQFAKIREKLLKVATGRKKCRKVAKGRETKYTQKSRAADRITIVFVKYRFPQSKTVWK